MFKLAHSGDNSEIIFSNFDLKYIDQLVETSNNTFGSNYIDKDSILKYVGDSSEMCTMAIDKNYDKLVGCCLFYEETIADAAKRFKMLEEEIHRYAGKADTICHTKQIWVLPEFKSTGLASRIFEKTLAKAKKIGLKTVLSPAWKRGDEYIPAEGILLKQGFERIKTIPMLWFDDKDYVCVECDGPCRCDGVIYYKNLD